MYLTISVSDGMSKSSFRPGFLYKENYEAVLKNTIFCSKAIFNERRALSMSL